ncbi:hypothetical protein PHYBOEH_006600 [Phytophthora boehmeriae]|uniref:Uncharacterized protein n=1 Tax=Phytophthora boehmeriae TaxID=109152 RepID=A0A8T1WED1_9STRA|nr:hypothetical protein PHYBOEH_006600 [Phytophthora boehmeriae]
MDRTSLALLRQQMREKENAPTEPNTQPSKAAKTTGLKKKMKTSEIKETSPNTSIGRLEPQSAITLHKVKSVTQAPTDDESTPLKLKRPAPRSKRTGPNEVSYTADVNAGLAVRQILQRSEFGDMKEYLQSTSKGELFQQALVVAKHVQAMKKKSDETAEAFAAEMARLQSKCSEVTSDLVERERVCKEHEKENAGLVDRLKIAQDEYQSLIAWVREHEDKLKASQQTKKDQAQLIDEMSKVQRHREDQLHEIKKEREQALCFAEEMQEQAMLQRDIDRIQDDLTNEKAENKKLLIEIQRKTQALDQMSNGIENARNQLSTLQGQVQLEAISRQSITQERDRLQQQYQRDREDWKSTQEHRDAQEKLKAEEFRKMDLEKKRKSAQAKSTLFS